MCTLVVHVCTLICQGGGNVIKVLSFSIIIETFQRDTDIVILNNHWDIST